ncbi:MAG: zf-HC2 domain-containing protein [Lachnospiraceae bacterium]|nr:zf-HC2 domain-containing protein [Lachnospiraceae bacterium]
MEKVSCNVIQDILPLYIDHTACDDTRMLVEEHLQECESCKKAYRELQEELLVPVDEGMKKRDAEEIRRFKKYLSRKRFRMFFISAAGVMALTVGVIFFMNHYIRHIDYQEAGFTFIEEDAEEVCFKDDIRGNYRWYNELDRDTGIMTIQYEQSLWQRYVERWDPPFDHMVVFLKKDMIKVVYADPDGTETTVWEATEEEKERYFQQERGALG